MRRALPIVLCALVLGGCGSAGDGAPVALPQLASVEFPQRPFVAQVDAPPAAVKEATEKAEAKKPKATAKPGSDVAPGAPTDAQIRAELAQLYGDDQGSVTDTQLVDRRAVLLQSGQATAPPDAPVAVQAIVDAGNKVARLPYVYGGGHGGGEGLFVDSAYDCSGSVSFALANAGLIDRPMTSGELAKWGDPGQGKWVTIYANAGHAFMVVGGARFDTVGLRQTGSRWQRPFRSISGFTAVHPPGL
jgi:cell wall-associated NlpC family hydrolase